MSERPINPFGQKLSRVVQVDPKQYLTDPFSMPRYSERLASGEVFGRGTVAILGSYSEEPDAVGIMTRVEEQCLLIEETFEKLEEVYRWKEGRSAEYTAAVENQAAILAWRFGLMPSFFSSESRCLVLLGIASEQLRIKRDIRDTLSPEDLPDDPVERAEAIRQKQISVQFHESRRQLSDDRVRLLAMDLAITHAAVPQYRRDLDTNHFPVSAEEAKLRDAFPALQRRRPRKATAVKSDGEGDRYPHEEPFSFDRRGKVVTNSQLRQNGQQFERKTQSNHTAITAEFLDAPEIRAYIARHGIRKIDSLRVWKMHMSPARFSEQFHSRAERQGDLICFNDTDGDLSVSAPYQRYVREHEFGHHVYDPSISAFFGGAIEESDVSDMAAEPQSYDELRMGYNFMDMLMDIEAGKPPEDHHAYGLRVRAGLKRAAHDPHREEEREFHKLLVRTFGVEGMAIYYAIDNGNESLQQAYRKAYYQPHQGFTRLLYLHDAVRKRRGVAPVSTESILNPEDLWMNINQTWRKWTGGKALADLPEKAVLRFTHQVEATYAHLENTRGTLNEVQLTRLRELYQSLWERRHGPGVRIDIMLRTSQDVDDLRMRFYEWYRTGMATVSLEELRENPLSAAEQDDFELFSLKNHYYIRSLRRMYEQMHTVPSTFGYDPHEVDRMFLTYLMQVPHAGYTWRNEGQGNVQSRKGIELQKTFAHYLVRIPDFQSTFDSRHEEMSYRLPRHKANVVAQALYEPQVLSSLKLSKHLAMIHAIGATLWGTRSGIVAEEAGSPFVVERASHQETVRVGVPGAKLENFSIEGVPHDSLRMVVPVLVAHYVRRLMGEIEEGRLELEERRDELDREAFLDLLRKEELFPEAAMHAIISGTFAESPLFSLRAVGITYEQVIESLSGAPEHIQIELLDYLERYTDLVHKDIQA